MSGFYIHTTVHSNPAKWSEMTLAEVTALVSLERAWKDWKDAVIRIKAANAVLGLTTEFTLPLDGKDTDWLRLMNIVP